MQHEISLKKKIISIYLSIYPGDISANPWAWATNSNIVCSDFFQSCRGEAIVYPTPRVFSLDFGMHCIIFFFGNKNTFVIIFGLDECSSEFLKYTACDNTKESIAGSQGEPIWD